MRATLASFALAALAALAATSCAACSVPDVDLAGKACPCATGYACVGGKCVLGSADASVGKISVSNLSVAWTTLNSIRWTWDREGAQADFGSFEMITGPTEDSVSTKTGAHIWTAVENPELGTWILRRTGSIDPVTATTTDGHAASTDVYGALIAIDNAGQRTATGIVKARTIDTAQSVTILGDDEPVAGTALPAGPDGFARSTTDAPTGSAACYAWTVKCGEAGTSCYENLQYLGMGLRLTPFSQPSFATAFVELAIAVDGANPSYWSDLALFIDKPACADPCRWSFAPIVLRTGGAYRTLQVPLSAFLLNGDAAPLSWQILSDGGFVLQGLSVGGSWSSPGRVRIAQARLRW